MGNDHETQELSFRRVKGHRPDRAQHLPFAGCGGDAEYIAQGRPFAQVAGAQTSYGLALGPRFHGQGDAAKVGVIGFDGFKVELALDNLNVIAQGLFLLKPEQLLFFDLVGDALEQKAVAPFKLLVNGPSDLQ